MAFLLIWGLLFAAAGVLLWWSTPGVTFDRLNGVYYRGNRYRQGRHLSGEGPGLPPPSRALQGRISDVAAIQLLAETVTSRSKNRTHVYTSYELNLVFADGERINIMDHGNLPQLEIAANELSQRFLWPILRAQNLALAQPV